MDQTELASNRERGLFLRGLAPNTLNQPTEVVEIRPSRNVPRSHRGDAIVPSGLIGLGIGGFGMYYFHYDANRGWFPHNILLEVGSELGLVGLAAFVLLCYLVRH